MQHGVLNQIPADWVALADYEQAAQQVLATDRWAYLQGGCVRPWHAVEASAFSSYQLLPRPLRDLRGGHSQVELFGQTLPHPFLLAPVAYQKLFHPAGEQATALAAQVSQTPLLLSSLASVSLQQIRHASTAILWFQLYWQGNRERSLALLRRAEHAGHQAIVVTIRQGGGFPDGGSLTWTSSVDAAGKTGWTCSGRRIAEAILPAECR